MTNDKPIGWEEEFDMQFAKTYLLGEANPVNHHLDEVKSFISRVEASSYQKGLNDAVGYIREHGNWELSDEGLRKILEAARNQTMV